MSEISLHLDVRPFWFQKGRVWAHTTLMIRASASNFIPAREIAFNGRSVLLPSDPEIFLREHYGENWRTPDPGFKYYPSKMSHYRSENLALALVTPAEFRLLKDRIEAKRKSSDNIGMIDSLAEKSLYPLYKSSN